MTYPGFQAQQAAQQAATRASMDSARYAQQSASRATDATLRAGRNASTNYYRRSPRRTGVFALLGRLLGLVITLAFIAVALGIFSMVLGRADPGWFDHAKSWIDGLI